MSENDTRHSIQPVQRRLLIPLALALLLLIGGFAAAMLSLQKYYLDREIQEEVEAASKQLKQNLKRETSLLAFVEETVLADQRLHDALKSGDRERLLTNYQQLFARIRERHEITHFYFHRPNRVNLLRLHQPERYGDLVERFTLHQAERTGTTASGIELGPLGTLTLRVVQPIFDDHTLIGYLELGKEIEGLLTAIGESSGVEVAVIISKSALDRAQWEAGMRMLGRKARWERYRQFVLDYSSMPQLPAELDRFLERMQSIRSDDIVPIEAKSDGNRWLVVVTPLSDTAGTRVGGLVVLRDISSVKAAFHRMLGLSFGGALLLLAALTGSLYVMLRRVDRRIRRQQAELAESEERLDLGMAVANDGIWDWHLDDDTVVFDARYYTMAGYEPNEFPGAFAEWAKRVHPDDLQQAESAVQQYVAGGREAYDVEFRFQRKGGDYMWIRARGQIVSRDEKGNPLRFVGTHSDITVRVRMEKELELHRQHLQKLVAERTATIRQQADIIDRTHDAVGILDLDGYISSWNRGAERMFGIGAGEAIGQHISIVYPEHQDELLESRIIAELEEKGTHEMEITLRRVDGSAFPVLLSLFFLYGRRRTPTTVAAYAVDISELKQREAELDRLNKQLQASNKELEAFAYSVSHDLRAPLRAIDGFSLALEEDYADRLDETAHDYLRRVRGGAQRMGMLIDALLQLSRVNRGELQAEKVDLAEIARSVIAELRAAEPDRRLELSLGCNMQVQGDPRLLRVMLDNLLDNAWKFTSREAVSHITFQRRTDNPDVFYISDNGVGFDMRYADKLFGAFQRLHRVSDFPGTGIGLATVQRIVHRHGGRVWAESQPAEGAIFYFSLGPAVESMAETTEQGKK